MPSFLTPKMAFSFDLMKKNQTVSFIKSAVTPAQYPEHDLPEIAFIGRSNVGKSSLLNTLVNKKNLARISNTPGRTQLINFFNIDENLCFVDLPGYGYAKVPERLKKQWKPMIESYLLKSRNLHAVVLILDARHKPSQHDRLMREWLRDMGIPTIIIATKIDKIPKTKQPKHLQIIEDTLNILPTESLLPFSALTAKGLKPVWNAIVQAIQTPQTSPDVP